MSTRPVALALASQVLFLSMLAVATLLDPGVATHRDEGGVSNFGVHAVTVVPYTLGFLGAAVLLWLAAAGLVGPSRLVHRVARGLRLLAVALVAVLVSTYAYRHAAWLHDVHVGLGTLAVAYEVLLGVWLAAKVLRDAGAYAALATQLVAAAVALGALLGVERHLYVGQVLGAAAFSVLLVRGVRVADGLSEGS